MTNVEFTFNGEPSSVEVTDDELLLVRVRHGQITE